MSTIIIITPPPPPPPPQNPQLSAVDLNAWYWDRAYRAGYLAAANASPLVQVKRWWKSKTVWLGTSLTAIGAAAKVAVVWAFAEKDLVVSAFGSYGPAVFLAFGAAVVALRLVTKGGLTK